MSGNLSQRFLEDRAMRDSARALIKSDINRIKSDFGAKSLLSRATGRLSEGAIDIFEEAKEVAEDNKGVLAALVAAVMLWFARNPIMSLFDDEYAETDDDLYEDEEFDNYETE